MGNGKWTPPAGDTPVEEVKSTGWTPPVGDTPVEEDSLPSLPNKTGQRQEELKEPQKKRAIGIPYANGGGQDPSQIGGFESTVSPDLKDQKPKEIPFQLMTEKQLARSEADEVVLMVQDAAERGEQFDPQQIVEANEGILEQRDIDAISAARGRADLLSYLSEPPKDVVDGIDKLKEVVDDPIQLVPFLAGAKEAQEMADVLQAANRLNEGIESDRDLLILKRFSDVASQDQTFWAEVVGVLNQLPSFAGELFFTGGVYTGVKKGTIKGTQKVINNLLTEGGQELLKKKLLGLAKKGGKNLVAAKAIKGTGDIALKSLGAIAGASFQTIPAGFTKITASAIKNMIPEVSLSEDEAGEIAGEIEGGGMEADAAILHALGDQWIETISEKSGGLFSALGAPVKAKIIKAAIVRGFIKANPTKKPSKIIEIARKAGWNGILEEMGEERLGEIGRAAIGLNEYNLPSMHQLEVELVSFAIPGMMISGANMATQRLEKIARKSQDNINNRGELPTKEELAAQEPSYKIGDMVYDKEGFEEAINNVDLRKEIADKSIPVEVINDTEAESLVKKAFPEGSPLVEPKVKEDVETASEKTKKPVEQTKETEVKSEVANTEQEQVATEEQGGEQLVPEEEKDTQTPETKEDAVDEEKKEFFGIDEKKPPENLPPAPAGAVDIFTPPEAPENKKNKHGVITEGKIHVYHSTNGRENLAKILEEGADNEKAKAVEGLTFGRVGEPYRKGDSYVVFEVDVNDIAGFGNVKQGSEVTIGKKITPEQIVYSSELTPEQQRMSKSLLDPGRKPYSKEQMDKLVKNLQKNDFTQAAIDRIVEENNKKITLAESKETKTQKDVENISDKSRPTTESIRTKEDSRRVDQETKSKEKLKESEQNQKRRSEIRSGLIRLRDKGLLKSSDKKGKKKGDTKMSDEEIDVMMKLQDENAKLWKEISGKDNYYTKFIKGVAEGNIEELEKRGGALYQTPEGGIRLTLKVFEDKVFQGFEQREMVSPQEISSALKSRGKQIEKDVINQILDREEFKQKRIPYKEFKMAVESSLMHLERLHTSKWADYGMSSINMEEGESTRSTVLNAPIEHGYTGTHFSSVYDPKEQAGIEWELMESPVKKGEWFAVNPVFHTMRSDMSEEELEALVGTQGSKDMVERWIAENKKKSNPKNIGMFGHFRSDFNDGVFTLLEFQSDFFQQNKAEEALYNTELNKQTVREKVNKNHIAPFEKKTREDMMELAGIRLGKETKNNGIVVSVEITSVDGEVYRAANSSVESTPDGFDHMEWAINRAVSDEFLNWGNRAQYKAFQKRKDDIYNEVNKLLREAGYKGKDVSTRFELKSAMPKISTDAFRDAVISNRYLELYNIDEAKYIAYRELPSEYKVEAEAAMEIISEFKRSYSQERRRIVDTKTAEYVKEIIEEKKKDPNNSIAQQFIASQKIHEDRIFREAVQMAADEGATTFRFPAPYTLAILESYIDDIDGEGVPYEYDGDRDTSIDVGDEIEWGGITYLVLDSHSEGFTAAQKDDVSEYHIPTYIEEEAIYRVDDSIRYEWDNHFEDSTEITMEQLEEFDPDETWPVNAKDLAVEYLNSTGNDSMSFDDIYDKLIEEVESSLGELGTEELIGHYGNEMWSDGDTVYTLETGSSVNFLQPDQYEVPSKEDFFDNISEEHQGIVKKYMKKIDEIKKSRPDARMISDDNGFEWLEFGISKEDREEPIVAFQKEAGEAKGAVEFLDDGAMIHIFDGADISTLAHEMSGHIGRRFLSELAKESPEFAEHLKNAEEWAEVKNGNWTRKSEEKFARGFEKYLRSGKTTNPSLAEVFKSLKKWLTNIYKVLKGSSIDVKLTPEIKRVFDAILRGERQKEKKGEKPVGIKKAMLLDEAIESAEMRINRKSFSDILKEGERLVNDTDMDVNALIEEVVLNGRIITPEETAVFMYEKRRVINEYDALLDERDEAKDGVERASVDARIAELEAEEMYLDVALAESGQQWSAAGQMRRYLIDSKYNLITMTNRIKKHYKDGIIPEAIQNELKEINRKYKEAESKIRKLEARIAKDDLSKIKAKVDEVMEGKFDSGEQIKATKESAKETAKKIADNLRKLKFRDGSSAGMAVEPISPLWDMAVETIASAIEAGGSLIDAISAGIDSMRSNPEYQKLSKKERENFEKDLTDQVNQAYRTQVDAIMSEDGRLTIPTKVLKEALENNKDIKDINDLVNHFAEMEEFKEFDERQIRDAISRYGETKQLTKDEISKQLNKMKTIGRLISGLEDVLNKKQRPLRSGLQRDKISDEERRLRNALKEAMAGLPITEAESKEKWKSSLESVKERLRNQIKDLNKQIETGEKTSKKPSLKYDAEAKNLRDERDRLKAIIETIEGPIKMSDEQRVRYAITKAQQTIKDLEHRIKTKNFDPLERRPAVEETPELKAIRAKRDKLREQYKKMKLDKFPPKTEEEKATDRALRNLEKKEQQLKEKILTKNLASIKKESKVKLTPEIQAAKKRVAALQEQVADMEKEAGIPEQRRIESLKTRTNKRIAELNQRIKDKNFDPKPKPKEIIPDKEARELISQKIKLQEQYEYLEEKVRQENKTRLDKVGDFILEVASFSKTLRTILDMSAVLRQGLLFFLANPKYTPSAMKAMFKQTFSEKNAKKWHQDILGHPLYDLMVQSKLYISDPSNPKMLAREEQFMSNWADKFWLTKWATKPSERSYVGYLNQLRVTAFLDGAESFIEQGYDPMTKDGAKVFADWAKYVNHATGRGQLGTNDKARILAKPLSALLFSPRLITARFNILFNGVFYAKMSKPARKKALWTTARFVGAGTTFIGLAWLMIGGRDGDDDDTYVEIDPRSSDFGKIRIGNTRIDIWGGFVQWVRMFSQYFSGQRKSTKTGKVGDLGSFGGDNRGDVLINFFIGKLAPTPSEIWKLSKAKEKDGELVTEYGDPITLGGEIASQTVPLYIADIADIYKEHGPLVTPFLASAAFFGVGVQNYGGTAKKSTRPTYDPEFTPIEPQLKVGEGPMSVDELNNP